MNNKKNFNLFLGIGIILVLSLYFIWAYSTATDIVFNNNVTANYDEGAFFINWTNDTTHVSPIGNWTVTLWMTNNFVNITDNANTSGTNFSWGYTWTNTTEANYTFSFSAFFANGTTGGNSSNVSMYVDSTAPLVNWTNSGYTNLTKKKNTDTLILNISVGDALSGLTGSYCVFNISTVVNYTVLAVDEWCNSTSINLTGLADGNHTIDVYANDTVGNVGVNLSTYSVWIDSTVPAVSTPTRPVINGNYSGSIVLNVSIVETIGTTLVWFNITNGTGVSNGTATASNGAGNFWNATLNTSLYPDGTYNVTVYANDTANNLNSSVYTGNFTIDNTNPVATFTCSPSTLGNGADTICTCTGTDAGSGVKDSLTTAAVTITTNSTFGTFTTGTSNCTITDYAGNTHNTTGTYTIASDSATDTTSSTTSTPLKWTGTFVINDNQFIEGYANQLEVKKRIRFKIKDIDHHIGVLELTETTVKIEVASTPQEATLAVGDERKFDVSEDGYYDIVVTLNSILGSKADITIKSISELITAETEAGEQGKEESAEKVAEGGEDGTETSIFKKWWFWLIVILVIIGVVYSSQKKKE